MPSAVVPITNVRVDPLPSPGVTDLGHVVGANPWGDSDPTTYTESVSAKTPEVPTGWEGGPYGDIGGLDVPPLTGATASITLRTYNTGGASPVSPNTVRVELWSDSAFSTYLGRFRYPTLGDADVMLPAADTTYTIEAVIDPAHMQAALTGNAVVQVLRSTDLTTADTLPAYWKVRVERLVITVTYGDEVLGPRVLRRFPRDDAYGFGSPQRNYPLPSGRRNYGGQP